MKARKFKIGDRVKFVGAVFTSRGDITGYTHTSDAWEIVNVYKHGSPQGSKQMQLEIRSGGLFGKIASGQVTHRLIRKPKGVRVTRHQLWELVQTHLGNAEFQELCERLRI